MMPDQPDEVLVAERRYRHPDGREAVLQVGPDNQPVRGIAYSIQAHDRPQARQAWATRGRQLHAAGYRPEPPAASAPAS